jgi:hypothetical protein
MKTENEVIKMIEELKENVMNIFFNAEGDIGKNNAMTLKHYKMIINTLYWVIEKRKWIFDKTKNSNIKLK